MSTVYKACTIVLIALTALLGCEEKAGVRVYEVAQPAAYEWPTTQARLSTHKADGIDWVWEVPAGWVDAPEVPEQIIADYRFPGTTQSLPGRLTVSMISGDAGGVQANVLRWKQQMFLTTVSKLGPSDKLSDPMLVPVGQAVFVDMVGQYQGPYIPTNLLAAIIQVPAQDGSVYQTWFFKLVGDAQTVEANRLNLARMVLTLRPADAPPVDLPENLGDLVEEHAVEVPAAPAEAQAPAQEPRP